MVVIEIWVNENEVVSFMVFNCLGLCRIEVLIVWVVIFFVCWCFEIWMCCNDFCWWYVVIFIESLIYVFVCLCSYVY